MPSEEPWGELEELYRQAEQRPPEERPGFLDAACAGNPELRHKIEFMLDRTRTAVAPGAQLGPYRLSPGDRLGPYEIVSLVGAGGMGEVYKATDARLRRTIAIKVLPRCDAADSERRKRLLREARAVSALNHPHIVAIYDVGAANGLDFLVMEFVAGQSLDRIIKPLGLPLPQALSYAAAIADALAAAHGAGIVHRDIKPGNVIAGGSDQLKVLDFGVAKLAAPPPGEFTETRTQDSAITLPGAIVGTCAYMSPEQAAGRPVDHRTDIFSLGVMLYEMVAGRRPFRGDSQPELLNAIIHAPWPPLAADGSRVPIEFEDILSRALAKDPAARYQHAGDFAFDLRRLKSHLESGRLPGVRAAPASRRAWRRWAIAAGAAAVLIVAAAGWRLRRLDYFWKNPISDAAITRLTDFEGDEIDGAISQDGKLVVFLSDRDGPLDAWVAHVGSGNFLNLTRGQFPGLLDQVAFGVGFTGDNSHVWLRGRAGDTRTNGVSLIPFLGGPARRFLDAAFSVAWSPDGARIVYAVGGPGGDSLFVAESDGAGARPVLASKPDQHAHYPIWSPDRRYIYYVFGGVRLMQADVWRVSVEGRNTRTHYGSQHRGAISGPPRRPNARLYRARRGWIGNGAVRDRRRTPRPAPPERRRRAVPFRCRQRGDGRRTLSFGRIRGEPDRPRLDRADLVRDIGGEERFAGGSPLRARLQPPYRPGLPALSFLHRRRCRRVEISEWSGTGALEAGRWRRRLHARRQRRRRPTRHDRAPQRPRRRLRHERQRHEPPADLRGDRRPGRPLLVPRRTVARRCRQRRQRKQAFQGQCVEWRRRPVDRRRGALSDLVARRPVHPVPPHGPDQHRSGYPRRRAISDPSSCDRVPERRPAALSFPPGRFQDCRNPGQYRQENFFLFDLHTGERRQLTDLKPGYSITSFDIVREGNSILFDRIRNNADIVLIEPKR